MPPAITGSGRIALATARFRLPLILLGAVAFALKAWSCICLFPVHAWNDVRLRPSFLIADGLPLYPGLNEGLITTWMYGPVHPLLFYPVTFIHDGVPIFILAAALNVLVLAIPLLAVCRFWNPEINDSVDTQGRLLCGVAALLLLPVNYLTFITADNPSLAFGILSVLLFSRGIRRYSRFLLWLAAIAATTSAFSKAHGIAVGAGETLWLLYSRRFKEAAGFGLMTIISLLAWTGVGISLASSPRAFWEHVVLIPSKLPWHPDIGAHALELSGWLAASVLLPGCIVAFLFWSGAARRHVGIPVFIWLTALPISLSATFKFGGNSNSLHPVFYFAPFLLLEVQSLGKDRAGWRTLIMLLVVGLAIATISEYITKPLSPVTQPCIEVRDLTRKHGDSLWLPWRPLATYLATGRHDHDEDGLHVRQITELYPSRAHAYAGLPAHWRWTAIEIPGMSWGMSAVMQPGPIKEESQGHWVIYSSPETVGANNVPAP